METLIENILIDNNEYHVYVSKFIIKYFIANCSGICD